MKRLPVLIAVDEELGFLADVGAQLARYSRDYRVEPVADPGDALRMMTELVQVGDEVALVLASISLSGAGGAELLEQVRRLHPHAKRALLVPAGAWADQATAEAIRDAIALGRIDYYVPRPAGSPDEVFHEAVSSFLLEWARERRLVPTTIHIVGEAWAGRAFELREVFARCAVPHAFCLADSDEGRELLTKAGPDVRLPIMVLPDGRVLSDPSDSEIAEAAGAPSGLEERTFDVLIVGAGPAGLSAAVYAASEGLQTLVVDEGGIGGQATEAPALKGKEAYVVGGGNSAGQAALHLARYCRQVTLLVRGESLDAGMSDYLVRTVEATPNVTVRTRTSVVGGDGEGRLQHLLLRAAATGEETVVPADALFVLIGARPNNDWLPVEIARDAYGFLLTGEGIPDGHLWPLERRPHSLETSMPGVLAAGDVRHASVKRVASAVGEGAIAVQLVHGILAGDPSHPGSGAESAAAASVAGNRTAGDPLTRDGRVAHAGAPKRLFWRRLVRKTGWTTVG